MISKTHDIDENQKVAYFKEGIYRGRFKGIEIEIF